MTEHARICRKHSRVCSVDGHDRVVCPVGGHVLAAGSWATGKVEGGRIQLDGQALIQERAQVALRVSSRQPQAAARHLQALALGDERLRVAMLAWAAELAIDKALGRQSIEAPVEPEDDEDEVQVPRRRAGGRPVGSKNKPREAKPDRAHADRGLALVAQTNLRDLMGEPLASGKRLGDSTGAEISEAAELAGKQARGGAVRARYLRLVADAIPAEKLARHSITEAKLGGLFGQAERDMERLGELLAGRQLGAQRALGGTR